MQSEKCIDRNCLTCRFHEKRHAPPPQIMSIDLCLRFPPIPVIMANAQGQPVQVAVHPLVNEHTYCHEWQAVESANH